jgi:hypothetical protein
VLIHRFETFPTEDNLKHLLSGLGNLGMDPVAAWDRFAGGAPLRAAQVLSQQSTAPPVVAAKQIKSMTTKWSFMVEPALSHPIAKNVNHRFRLQELALALCEEPGIRRC